MGSASRTNKKLSLKFTVTKFSRRTYFLSWQQCDVQTTTNQRSTKKLKLCAMSEKFMIKFFGPKTQYESFWLCVALDYCLSHTKLWSDWGAEKWKSKFWWICNSSTAFGYAFARSASLTLFCSYLFRVSYFLPFLSFSTPFARRYHRQYFDTKKINEYMNEAQRTKMWNLRWQGFCVLFFSMNPPPKWITNNNKRVT